MGSIKITITVLGKEKYNFTFHCFKQENVMVAEIEEPNLWNKSIFPQPLDYVFEKTTGSFCVRTQKNTITGFSELKEYLKEWVAMTVFVIENNKTLEKELEDNKEAKEYNKDGNLKSYFEKFHSIFVVEKIHEKERSFV